MDRYPYFDPDELTATLIVILHAIVPHRELHSWLEAVSGKFTHESIKVFKKARNIAVIGDLEILDLYVFRDETEALLAVEGWILPFMLPEPGPLNVEWLEAETWFLAKSPDPDPSYLDCKDARVHHAYFAPGGYLQSGMTPPDQLDWPPTQNEVNPFPPGVYTMTEPARTVLEDYYYCNRMLEIGAPFQPYLWCGNLPAPAPDDFYRILTDGFSPPVYQIRVRAGEMSSDLRAVFDGYADFVGLDVSADVSAIAWLGGTDAAATGTSMDGRQALVPEWDLFVGEGSLVATIVVKTLVGNQFVETTIDGDGDGIPDFVTLRMPPFRMHFNTPMLIGSGASMNALAQKAYPDAQDALHIEFTGMEVLDGYIHPDEVALPKVIANGNGIPDELIPTLESAIRAGHGGVAPELGPAAVADSLWTGSYFEDLAWDLEDQLPYYTFHVNPLFARNIMLVTNSADFKGVGPARASKSFREASDCPDMGYADDPPNAPEDPKEYTWTETVGFVVLAGAMAGGNVIEVWNDPKGDVLWLAVDSAELPNMSALQTLQDPTNQGNPLEDDDHPLYRNLLRLLTSSMDLAVPSIYQEDCDTRWYEYTEAIDLNDAYGCIELCAQAEDDFKAKDFFQTCLSGCSEYYEGGDGVEAQFFAFCEDPAYLLLWEEQVIPNPSPLGIPPFFVVDLCVTTAEDFAEFDTLFHDWDNDGDDWIIQAVPYDQREPMYVPDVEATPSCVAADEEVTCRLGFDPEYLVSPNCAGPGFPATYTVDRPDPYLAIEGEQVELRAPAWADLVADVVLKLDVDFDGDALSGDERCPADGSGFDPRIEIEIQGKLLLQMNYEWSFPLHTQRRWQWTGGWRADNLVANPILEKLADASEVASIDLVQYPEVQFGVGVDGVCLDVDQSDILVTRNDTDLEDWKIKDLIHQQLEPACSSPILESILASGAIGQLGQSIPLPFFDENFFSMMSGYDDVHEALWGDTFYKAGPVGESLYPVPPMVRALEMAERDLRRVSQGLVAGFDPHPTMVEPREAALLELWEQRLCNPVATDLASVEECDDTLMGILGSDVATDPGAPIAGFVGAHTPSSTGGVYQAVFDPAYFHLPPDWDSQDPHGGPGLLNTFDLEDDVTYPTVLPVWDPGRP